MSLLSSIKYGNSQAEYKQGQLSASTRRKLDSLGIDPTLVTSETQALSLIATRELERSFEEMAASNEPKTDTPQQKSSSESSLISEAKLLAEQLGVSLSPDDTFEEITAGIASAIEDLLNRSADDPQALQRAQAYKAQLSELTGQYSDISASNTNLYSAMSLQAYNTRYMLGL